MFIVNADGLTYSPTMSVIKSLPWYISMTDHLAVFSSGRDKGKMAHYGTWSKLVLSQTKGSKLAKTTFARWSKLFDDDLFERMMFQYLISAPANDVTIAYHRRSAGVMTSPDSTDKLSFSAWTHLDLDATCAGLKHALSEALDKVDVIHQESMYAGSKLSKITDDDAAVLLLIALCLPDDIGSIGGWFRTKHLGYLESMAYHVWQGNDARLFESAMQNDIDTSLLDNLIG